MNASLIAFFAAALLAVVALVWALMERRRAAAVGRALDTAVGKYNQFVGSLESQVMVSARRFEDLHVDHEGKDLPGLPPVEQSPRSLSRPELAAPATDVAAE